MDKSNSALGAFTWSYPLWFGMDCGDYMFGGTLQPSGDSFTAIFTTEARAQRFIVAASGPDAIEAIAACIEDEESLHEWLTDLKQSGHRYVVFNPLGPTVERSRSVEIGDLLSKLKSGCE